MTHEAWALANTDQPEPAFILEITSGRSSLGWTLSLLLGVRRGGSKGRARWRQQRNNICQYLWKHFNIFTSCVTVHTHNISSSYTVCAASDQGSDSTVWNVQFSSQTAGDWILDLAFPTCVTLGRLIESLKSTQVRITGLDFCSA